MGTATLSIPLQRANGVDCCEEALYNCNQDPTALFGRLVTENETGTPLQSTQPTRNKDLKETGRQDTKPTMSHTIGWQDHHHHLLGL